MIELPEAITLAKQARILLKDKVVTGVYNATHLHKFTFFNGDPSLYGQMLIGKQVQSANGFGIFVDVNFNDNNILSISDGINMRYGDINSKIPQKYQLLITFNDNTFLSFTTSMYGAIALFKNNIDNKYRTLSLESISPLSTEFDENHFDQLITKEKKNISIKALLASEQRIPGLCNGVLHDILFNANIHHKSKIRSLSDENKSNLFSSLKNTLKEMTEREGRDTESDLLGNKGKYKTILSRITYGQPCIKCGDHIQKEAYMGGSIYYCPSCQQIQ